MKTKTLLMFGLVLILAAIPVSAVFASGGASLAGIRAATARFHLPASAKAAGWYLVPGLDYCFQNPGVGAMGFHYINTGLLDTSLNPFTPEAMVYAPGPNGQLQLAAVEYIVPAALWDATGAKQPPTVLGRSLHLNPALGVYVLHAWIWRNNPNGMFADWNPMVSCP